MIPIFQNAVKDAGWVLEESLKLSPAAVWTSIVSKYVIGAVDGVVNIANAVDNFINDMDDEEGGKKSIRFSIIPGISLVLHEDINGWLVSDWLSPSTRVRLNLSYNDPSKKVTVGPVGTFTGFYPDWHDFEKYAFSYCTDFYTGFLGGRTIREWDGDILVPISYPFYYGQAEPVSYDTVGWRIVIKSLGSRNVDGQYINHLKYRTKEATWQESDWVIHERDVIGWANGIGYLPEERENETISFAPFSGVPTWHIGSDIKNVSSITGGNGADAWEPNPTLDIIGQGGNGGHGGGGGGAGGYCKQEVITGNIVSEIDLTQKIGNMTPGRGGTGTNGSAGHNGGCIIFY